MPSTTAANISETLQETAVKEEKVHQDGIWVFGYGSLIWKPPIHYESKQIGYIKNYVRRFWQHSEDHRGTPEKPGRVVTLIPFDEWKTIESIEGHDRVTWGVAFKIPSDDVEATRAYLDHREKALAYIATTDNEAYVGPAPAENIAKQIYETYGPSGWNAEYLLNLADALREISPDARDDHVFELETLVKKHINNT
ncbi:ChaC-like protein [Backusella circina FSU 941]|nr:ChaC-like protein [Backusella circina FSU 941]